MKTVSSLDAINSGQQKGGEPWTSSPTTRSSESKGYIHRLEMCSSSQTQGDSHNEIMIMEYSLEIQKRVYKLLWLISFCLLAF